MSQPKKDIKKINWRDERLFVPWGKWELVAWYGTWDQLVRVFDWCLENDFLKYDLMHFKNEWLVSNFREYKTWPKKIGSVDIKLTWYGTLDSLVEFFIILDKLELIREKKIRSWVTDHFVYKSSKSNENFKIINHNSLKVIWSRMKEHSKGANKGLPTAQRDSLIKLLDSFKK